MGIQRCGALLGACALLLGCDNDVNVRAEWGKSIALTGLRPVYPLRENLYIGDILLFVFNPCIGDAITRAPQTMLLGSLPEDQIAQAFAGFYGDRPHLPVTPDKSKPDSGSGSKTPPPPSKINITMSSSDSQTVTATSGAPPAASSSAAASGPTPPAQNSPPADKGDPIFGRGRNFQRMPMAAIPSISLFSYVGGSAGGLFDGISAAFSGQTSKKIKVSAQQIEVSELPAGAFANIVANFQSSPAHDVLMQNMALYKSILDGELAVAGCRRSPNAPNPQIVYVNSVYYTRNLVFEFGEDSAFAAKLAATFPAAAAVPNTKFTGPTIPTATNSTNPAEVSAQSLLGGLATMSGGPGAGGSIAVGTSGNLALNQTFARPMAFATQHALFYELDIDTNGKWSEHTAPTKNPPGPDNPAVQLRSSGAPPGTTNQTAPPATIHQPDPQAPLKKRTVTPLD